MKWMKYSILLILDLILLATAALAIAGIGSDANRMRCSVVIRQKPAAIWPWLCEADKSETVGDLAGGGAATRERAVRYREARRCG